MAAAPAPRARAAAAVEEPVEDEATPFDAAEGGEEEERYAEDGELPEVINLADVEAATYEVIPRGVYPGYIESVEYALSQSKGLPMLTWVLKFDYEDKERTLRFYTTLTGDGAGRTKATLMRLDPELDLSAFAPDEADGIFAGQEVNVRVTVRPDRDDRSIKRNNVQDIWPLDEEDED